jgi:TolA-binding protein
MERRSLPPFEDDFTRALLRSADQDEPSKAAYGKAATALGVGVGLGVGASLPAAAAGAATLTSGGRWSGSFVAKLGAFAVSGALLVASGVALLRPGSSSGSGSATTGAALAPTLVEPPIAVVASPSPAAAGVAAAASNAASVSSAPPASAEEAPDVFDLPEPSAAPRVAARARVRSGAKAVSGTTGAVSGVPTAPESSLAEQVRSLDRARVALASGFATGALHELSRYRKAYPNGVFLTEASVLEIEAFAARGDRNLAASRAAAFVAAHPDSPQAERLRQLIPAKRP